MTGLRADNFGDIAFIDHVDVKIRGETYSALIAVGGATTCVTAFAPSTKDGHETVGKVHAKHYQRLEKFSKSR